MEKRETGKKRKTGNVRNMKEKRAKELIRGNRK